jgi:hypothetical protein
LTHQPKVIAAAATFIASKHSNIPLNSDATKGLPWWSAFDVSIDEVQGMYFSFIITKNYRYSLYF